MKTIFILITFLSCLWLVPVRAEDDESPTPVWQLYHDSGKLRACSLALLACEGLPGLEEYAALLRRHCEERAASCRERRQTLHFEGIEVILRDEADKLLAEAEASLRGETRRSDSEQECLLVLALEELPRDAQGEPWLNVPKAQQRLRGARQALFLALADGEYRQRRGMSHEQYRQFLSELLPLHAAFRREMQLWGIRSMPEERLMRWEREARDSADISTMSAREVRSRLDYLRDDAEEAAAQYDRHWRRACRRAAADIRYHLRDHHAAWLPGDPSWLMGEPMGQGVPESAIIFYRLRDALAFCALAQPLAGQALPDSTLAELAREGELLALSPMLDALRGAHTENPFRSISLRWPAPWNKEETSVCDEIRARSGIRPDDSPVSSREEGWLRVEAEAERMRQALEAADKLVPTLPAKPDAACRRLLVQLAAQWYAYTHTLRRWGNEDEQRAFWWYGGCVGFLHCVIWGDAYYLPGIHLSCRENEQFIKVDQSNAHTLLRALIAEMRGQLEASLAEHRQAREGQGPRVPLPPEECWGMELPLPGSLTPPQPPPQPEGDSP